MTVSAGPASGRIFMSYRREETAYPAAWLFDMLASHFGRDQVFKDIDSIELGDDFVEVITTAVGSCEVLLALIGRQWLTITDENGYRRLDNAGDFVRLEIEAALTRNVRVIPILVDGARMPRADELPASLGMLARRQALELSPGRFGTDTGRLLGVLGRTISEAQEEARQEAGEGAARREAGEQPRREAGEQPRREADEPYVTVDTGTAGTRESTVTLDSDGGSATIPETAEIVAAPQAARVAPATARAGPAAETTRLRGRSAAQCVDAGFIILIASLCVIALDALIRPSTTPVWPWWVVISASVLGAAVTLGGVVQHPVPACVLLWSQAWQIAYSLSVIGTGHSSPSTAVAVLSGECIVAAVVSAAFCLWIVVLLPKGIRSVNLFLAISVGCTSAALALGAVALHTGKAGAWTAVGVLTLAAALGIILTLVRTHQLRPGR